MHFLKIISNIILGSILILTSITAGATVSIFQESTGPLFDLDYAVAGVATVNARYIGPFGSQTPKVVNDSVTGLSFSRSVFGDGTGLLEIDYQLHNTSVSDSFNLGLIIRVDPDGTGLFSEDTGSSIFSSIGAREPVGWEIDSPSGNIDSNINGGSLDNSNNCAPEGCDLIYALQWDLGQLDPGQTATVRIGLSDDGQTLSSNFLDANSVSDSASLRFSGVVTSVVPIPAALPLLISGLIGLFFMPRRAR